MKRVFCGPHHACCYATDISVATNQRTAEVAVFSVGAAPRLYNEYLRQMKIELRESLEMVPG
jgi:hypothetical protein